MVYVYSLLLFVCIFVSCLCFVCFFYLYVDHRDLHVLTHAFPTRRSSGSVFAMLPPTSNASESVCVNWPLPRSASMLASPFNRFSPRVSIVFSSTCGLVAGKLVGLIASTKLRVAKRNCSFCKGSTQIGRGHV